MDDHSESGADEVEEPDGDDVDEPESDDVEEREIERPVARETAARALRDLADGVAAGAVSVGEGDDALTEPVPGTVDLETELEVEAEEVELEVELEWARGDGEPAAVGEDAAADHPGETSPTESAAPETASEHAAHAESGGDGGEDPAADSVPVGAADGRRSQARFEVYRDRGGEWRWRLVHRNGNVIATGGEGYGRRRDARRGMESVMRNAADAAVDDEGAP